MKSIIGVQLQAATFFEGLNLVELLDDFGIRGDTHVFALRQQQLLVNQIAQHIFISFGDDLIGVDRILLLRLLF